jgi:hypothetical protein
MKRTNRRKNTPIPLLAEHMAWLIRASIGKTHKAATRATLAEACWRASEKKGGGR